MTPDSATGSVLQDYNETLSFSFLLESSLKTANYNNCLSQPHVKDSVIVNTVCSCMYVCMAQTTSFIQHQPDNTISGTFQFGH